MANKKKAVSRAAIGELIRKHKGKNAVESENIGGCKNPKYHRYQFVGLSGGVLHLDLENLTEHMMPADSKTAKKWHVRRAAKKAGYCTARHYSLQTREFIGYKGKRVCGPS